MSPTDVLAIAKWEGAGLFLMARILGNSGVAVNQASISSIAINIYDINDGYTNVYTGTLVVASTVFDTLQTPTLDPRWTADKKGYNFGASIPASAFPSETVDKDYRVEILFTPTSGDPIAFVTRTTVKNLYST